MHRQTGPIKMLQRRNEKTGYEEEDGIIRVEERLDKSNLNNECKHPIVLPKGSPISN